MVELVSGGSVIKGKNPPSFFQLNNISYRIYFGLQKIFGFLEYLGKARGCSINTVVNNQLSQQVRESLFLSHGFTVLPRQNGKEISLLS